MKKSLLALAVISAATMASAEVKLSGDITVDLTSENGSRAVFGESGSELNIDASQDIGGGNTAYAHMELELDGHNKTGGIAVDEGRVGIKGGWGDLRLGDSGNACGAMQIGGGASQVIGNGEYGDCNDGKGGKQGITYRSPDMGGFKGAISYHPDDVPGEEETAIGLAAEMGMFEGSIGYNTVQGSDVNTLSVAAGVNVGDFHGDVQYQDTDGGKFNDDIEAWAINMDYAVPTGLVYASYGQQETTDTAGVETNEEGWNVGYTHDISDRTWTWIEFGETDSDDDTSWSTGLGHKF